MNLIQKTLLALGVALLIGGCARSTPSNSETTESPVVHEQTTQCTEPRPEMCTREYMPVCATKSTGIVCVTTPCPSTEEVTYPTGCTACADPKVSQYRPGQCE